MQRSGLLSGFTFLCLLTINSDDLATESLSILSRLGDFLCRLQANRRVYQLRDDEIIELDFAGIVQVMEQYQIDKIEEKVFLDAEMSLEVRLFIYLLPLNVYRERIRKANLNAKKNGVNSAGNSRHGHDSTFLSHQHPKTYSTLKLPGRHIPCAGR